MTEYLDDTVVDADSCRVGVRFHELLAGVHETHVVDERGVRTRVQHDRMVVDVADRRGRQSSRRVRCRRPRCRTVRRHRLPLPSLPHDHHIVTIARRAADGDVGKAPVDIERRGNRVGTRRDENRACSRRSRHTRSAVAPSLTRSPRCPDGGGSGGAGVAGPAETSAIIQPTRTTARIVRRWHSRMNQISSKPTAFTGRSILALLRRTTFGRVRICAVSHGSDATRGGSRIRRSSSPASLLRLDIRHSSVASSVSPDDRFTHYRTAPWRTRSSGHLIHFEAAA